MHLKQKRNCCITWQLDMEDKNINHKLRCWLRSSEVRELLRRRPARDWQGLRVWDPPAPRPKQSKQILPPDTNNPNKFADAPRPKQSKQICWHIKSANWGPLWAFPNRWVTVIVGSWKCHQPLLYLLAENWQWLTSKRSPQSAGPWRFQEPAVRR